MSLKNKVDMSEVQDETEIERRFLLKRLPNGLRWDDILEITQAYLSNIDDSIVERIRYTIKKHKTPDDEKWYHTTKERISDMSVREIEKEIGLTEYHELWDTKKKRFITKDRYIKKVEDNLKWEIDIFDNLIIAEIEIPNEDYDLKIPEWLEPFVLMEITGMYQFSNSNLAQ